MYIDTQQDLEQYKTEVADQLIYVIPLLESSRQHLVKNNMISFYVICSGKEYIFPYKHPESVYNDYTIQDILQCAKCYFYDKQVLNYQNLPTKNVYDLELVHYLNTIESLEVEGVNTEYFYNRLHSKYTKTNTLVSIANFVEYCRLIITQAKLYKEEGLMYYDKLQQLFYKIESSGLQVDKNYFTTLYGTPINLIGDKVYTKYNFFTSTGRPSNRFGGINFAALNKQDDTRKCFVSRYEDGQLLEVDFKAYHPHIIAHLCDYDFGNENVYEHLAKYYFDTLTPTKEQTTKAKEFTFNQMYGGINKKYLDIEFFAKAKAYLTQLWKQFKEDGYVESSISGRRFYAENMEDMSDSKLFNYYIQMTETELNGIFLDKILSAIDTNKATPILYTYDSVAFDCKKEYINKIISEIIASAGTKFPVTVKVGDNYKEMTLYNYETTTPVHFYN